ncbi:alkylhydroperoxidase, partial [Mycobacterium tuberculosis]|nr:alkylhydroperoxidase [Mycobacterium tuberculosis]
VDLARALNDTPAAVTLAAADALRREGLDEGERVDVVLAAAIFGWANRLMHTLGHSTPQKRR